MWGRPTLPRGPFYGHLITPQNPSLGGYQRATLEAWTALPCPRGRRLRTPLQEDSVNKLHLWDQCLKAPTSLWPRDLTCRLWGAWCLQKAPLEQMASGSPNTVSPREMLPEGSATWWAVTLSLLRASQSGATALKRRLFRVCSRQRQQRGGLATLP